MKNEKKIEINGERKRKVSFKNARNPNQISRFKGVRIKKIFRLSIKVPRCQDGKLSVDVEKSRVRESKEQPSEPSEKGEKQNAMLLCTTKYERERKRSTVQIYVECFSFIYVPYIRFFKKI